MTYGLHTKFYLFNRIGDVSLYRVKEEKVIKTTVFKVTNIFGITFQKNLEYIKSAKKLWQSFVL